MTVSTAVESAAGILGDRARSRVPIAPLTTYRLGGPAALHLTIETPDDVARAREAVRSTGVPVLVVGKGSNLLVADRGFDGLVLALGGQFAELDIDGSVVRAGGGVALPVLARRTAAAGLTGLEWAVGVPGSVGGAVRMNAGGHGSQTVETLRRCRFVDLRGGEDGVRDAAALGLGYRRSNVEAHHLVLWAEFELVDGDAAQSEKEISEIVKWRRDHQPGGRNAGSVFTNPAGDSAGRLIDAAGLRGHRVGSAFVSPKHANFVQSEEGGTAADVLTLMTDVRRRVREATGVTLEPEVRLVGFTDEELAGLREAGGGDR